MKSAPSVDVKARDEELGPVLKSGIARLEDREVPSAAFTAELLLLHILGRGRAWLYAHPEYQLSSAEVAAFAKLIESRAEGVPTQYLAGSQEFWGLEFEVGPGVLIPRPETEHVIEVALASLADQPSRPLRIADIGTGSGCIAIALASELPRAEIVATDISGVALGFAKRNADRHGVSARIHFHHADLLPAGAETPAEPSAGFDLIVSNPPYVGLSDSAQLAREVRDHEPAEALFAGERGFDLYPRLVGVAARALVPGGLLVVEIGYNGTSFVHSLFSAPGWSDVRITRDLAGIERVISARLSP